MRIDPLAKSTITEALAELKTIEKRITKKREFVVQYLGRAEVVRDPLEKDGGSIKAIQEARQSIDDLHSRSIVIRRSIADANAKTTITVEGAARSIADWLIWRREVAPQRKNFLESLSRAIASLRSEAKKRDMQVSSVGENATGGGYVINLNEGDLAKQIEEMELILGNLDGQLSLKNATVVIDI